MAATIGTGRLAGKNFRSPVRDNRAHRALIARFTGLF